VLSKTRSLATPPRKSPNVPARKTPDAKNAELLISGWRRLIHGDIPNVAAILANGAIGRKLSDPCGI